MRWGKRKSYCRSNSSCNTRLGLELPLHPSPLLPCSLKPSLSPVSPHATSPFIPPTLHTPLPWLYASRLCPLCSLEHVLLPSPGAAAAVPCCCCRVMVELLGRSKDGVCQCQRKGKMKGEEELRGMEGAVGDRYFWRDTEERGART